MSAEGLCVIGKDFYKRTMGILSSDLVNGTITHTSHLTSSRTQHMLLTAQRTPAGLSSPTRQYRKLLSLPNLLLLEKLHKRVAAATRL